MDFSNLTVLLVDDEIPFRKFVRKILEKELNVNVVEAPNPQEAFEFLEDNIPDLIILDMEMPVMDGYTALKTLRQMPNRKDIAVITCSALNSADLLLSLYQLKISDYILKPSNSKTIIKKISAVLNTVQINKEKT
jgi:CheY-like chemotaxis protein